MAFDAHLQRAEALIEVNRTDEALAEVGKSLAEDPENAAAHRTAAQAHLTAAQWPQAGQAAHRALQLEPDSYRAALQLAVAANGTRDFNGARGWAAESIRLNPSWSRPRAFLAQLEAGRGKHAQARELAAQAVQLEPDSSFCHFSYGRVLRRDGRYAAAEQALRRALELDPEDSSALSELGEVLGFRGRPKDAAELLQLAARADVRDTSTQQDMLRYTRGAGFGLATLPVMAILVFLSFGGGLATAVFLTLAVLLAGLRARRLWRFPPAVRRILMERTFEQSSWEMGGAPGFRPWWWRIISRMPASVPAAACWAWTAFEAFLSGNAHRGEDIYLTGTLAVIFTVRAVILGLRARQTLAIYE